MTEKQKLQKDRAWFKYVLTGLYKPIELKSLTDYEQEEWATILNIRDNLLDVFDKKSKELGLNVPEHRCWCGKPAKLQVDYYGKGNLIWVCNKHKELTYEKI